MNMDSQPLLEVKNLRTHFSTPEGVVKAVDGVSFSVQQGKTLALVGESGCGKTVSSLSIIRLLGSRGVEIKADKMQFAGRHLLAVDDNEMRLMRGKDISMIFQEPMTSLNPVHRIRRQLGEIFDTHFSMSREEVYQASITMLKKVGIPKPDEKIECYPHELSGGLRQRVMIAIALACRPKLVIADEPTTALDVTIQAQIMQLLKDMQRDMNMSILLITHDFGVVAEMAHRVAVMYAGKIVEEGDFADVFNNPLHPYTALLIHSIPGYKIQRGDRLETISGMVPNPLRQPKGCKFHPRCPYCMDICRTKAPELMNANGHSYACWKGRVPNEQ